MATFISGREAERLAKVGLEVVERSRGLTPRWSQRRLRIVFMDSLSYTTVIEFAEPLAGRRGSAFDR